MTQTQAELVAQERYGCSALPRAPRKAPTAAPRLRGPSTGTPTTAARSSPSQGKISSDCEKQGRCRRSFKDSEQAVMRVTDAAGQTRNEREGKPHATEKARLKTGVGQGALGVK